MRIQNSQGKVFYGMHFYPGVAEYSEPGSEPFRVFLNEDTLRAMDPTFAGRPVFVMHVDEVDQNLDTLRGEADGWVSESFYNQADGKHWVKFIVVSEKGERAIARGMRLSNCYVPKASTKGGLWNGVSYAKEITSGEFEHLAIVPNPRYEESVILTPEDFKKYNESKILELKRLANDKKESGPMKLNLWKRTKVENAADLTDVSVTLPKSGRELTITELVNEADAAEGAKKDSHGMAHPDHMVDMGEGSKMTVNDLVTKHKALCDELEKMKAATPDEEGEKAKNDGDESMANEEDDKKKDLKAEDDDKEVDEAKKKNEADEKAADELEVARAKKAEAKVKADRLRNAPNTPVEVARVDLSEDLVARGKSRYGSN